MVLKENTFKFSLEYKHHEHIIITLMRPRLFKFSYSVITCIYWLKNNVTVKMLIKVDIV